jgi:hypothetical protein
MPPEIGHKTLDDLLDDLVSAGAKTASPHFGTRDAGAKEIVMIREEILRRFQVPSGDVMASFVVYAGD